MQQNAAVEYDYTVVRWFTYTTILFGIIGMTIGTLIALQLAFPSLNEIAGEYTAFGRLRPLHTNGVAFGFSLSGIFAGWYYVAQRTMKVSLAEYPFLNFLAKAHFVVYFITILLAVVTLWAGITTSKEYAQLEWPLDLLVVVFWVLWGMNMFGMMGVRREKSIYIAVWYFISTFLAIAMLYIFNNLEVPTALFSNGVGSIWKSVSMYSGTNDALVQWWYGHNAVAFVFTAPIIALIYYYLPKESGQPVFSYKLSLYSFWSLMFVYLWAGSHHLVYSTVPDWMQTFGVVFSVVLILPSWGTAINMLLTMKGQWHQISENPLIKLMVLASTFYMFSTIEGPIQSIKSVNALAHFTDWIVGHVHDGVLGWVAFMIMAAIYHMAPRIFGREIYSKKLVDTQFWIQTIGIILYFTSMWIAGITQGLMWRATDQFGNLAYSFIDTVNALHPYYVIRGVGGLLYLIGFFIFSYNIIKTMTSARELSAEPANKSPMGV